MTDIQDLLFERLGPGDVDELVDLERLAFTYPWTREQFKLGLSGQAFRVFGMREPGPGGLIVAYISFNVVAGEMEVLNIAVRPEHRRRGIARRLLGLVLRICYTLSVAEVFLEVRRSNVAALSLYASFGFREVGWRKGYYPDNLEDALVLRCDLARLFASNGESDPGTGT